MYALTRKEVSKDETSVNAQLLIKAGFIERIMAGVYSYLPLGLRVIEKIKTIVREEMNLSGGEELLMPALQPKEFWETTGRWNELDVLFKVKSGASKEYALGPTHEEIVVPLTQRFIQSYRDLPKYPYQIQTKFRDEPRAKSGILRGREFIMKDLYSFHANENDLNSYYETMKKTYKKVFERCGLDAKEVYASGGTFSKFSHEYQVLTEFGEDTIFWCECGYALNQEIAEDLKDGSVCPKCSKKIKQGKAIEVGNIFKLNRKYSDPFGLTYMDENGEQKPVYMGCYGIGISRLMGAIAEIHNDESGLIWPKEVAPCDIHIVLLNNNESILNKLLKKLDKLGKTYIIDDRGISAGESLKDADLIGCPIRIVISNRSTEKGGVEIKKRDSKETSNAQISEIDSLL